MPASPVELEVAFMIRAVNAPAIGRLIAGLQRIGDYSMHHTGAHRIRDIHFDTLERRLGTRGFVLRIRRLDAGDLLTLKGASRATTWGGVERLEIEGPWSSDTYGQIEQALAGAGIDLGMSAANFEAADHIAAMRAAGFDIIQYRETGRITFSVSDDGGAQLAELSLDRVSLRLGARIARFTQAEIESKSAAGASQLPALTAALRAQMGDALRDWPFGKLATGLALADRFAAGVLDDYCDADGEVTPEGVDALEQLLTARRPAVSP
ncbi:MAG: CYTH domain-containing protein [Chloroflexi bacterium]|nr:CYTH domain-containing protein [Chloroflexota bacterium]